MKKLVLVIFLLTLTWSCATKEKKEQIVVDEKETASKEMQHVTPGMTTEDLTIYNFAELEPLLHQEDDKVYVINFWATWCAPCVKELPYFEKVHAEENSQELEVMLVSIDMPKMWETHLIPFIQKKELKATVVVLNDTKQNEWIPKVDPNWEGTIPATLIYKGKNRKFYAEPFTYESLREEIDTFLK